MDDSHRNMEDESRLPAAVGTVPLADVVHVAQEAREDIARCNGRAVAFQPALFDDLQRTFDTHGYTFSPETALSAAARPALVGSVANAIGSHVRTESAKHHDPRLGHRAQKRLVRRQQRSARRQKQRQAGENKLTSPEDDNVFAFQRAKNDPYGTDNDSNGRHSPADGGDSDVSDTNVDDPNTPSGTGNSNASRFYSVFHGTSEKDYLGRSILHIPAGTDAASDLRKDVSELIEDDLLQQSYVPKSVIHTYEAHARGCSAIRLFPTSGHLLLTVGLDGLAKLWDTYNDRRCLRTFYGHTKGIRGTSFNHDGTRFLTASYDRSIALWDTETGQCIRTFECKRTPLCVEFYPVSGANEAVFLVGMDDNKILQYDSLTGEIEQVYDQHLGAVNSITFVDHGRRFVSTSDDKTIRCWDFGIPVVIKYIADPAMHAISAVALSPTQRWLACQSLDNRIVVYSARDKFQLNKKKEFRGHLVAGYSCKPSFSPDSRYLVSGDSEGKLWIWDWKTAKVLKRLPSSHKGVVVDTQWLPHETSKLLTASWDGTVKLWD